MNEFYKMVGVTIKMVWNYSARKFEQRFGAVENNLILSLISGANFPQTDCLFIY